MRRLSARTGVLHMGRVSSLALSFARMMDAATFITVAEVETRRRHVLEATEVCTVTDGALWLQDLVDLHRPDAVRI